MTSEAAPLREYKFVVPPDRFYEDPTDPARSYKGFCVVVRAYTEADARARAVTYAQENGRDAGFLTVTRVSVLDPSLPGVVCWVEL